MEFSAAANAEVWLRHYILQNKNTINLLQQKNFSYRYKKLSRVKLEAQEEKEAFLNL